MTRYRGLISVVALIVLIGAGVAWWRPNGALLAWWLLSGLLLGAWISLSDGWTGLGPRARTLVRVYGVLVFFALLSTQVAARRVTSATHFHFEGVLLERVDSVVIASGETGVDVTLPQISATQVPWKLTVKRDGDGWRLADGAAVEQVRISPASAEPVGRLADLARVSRAASRFSVLGGVVLDGPDDVVVVRDVAGDPLDSITLVREGRRFALRSTRGSYELVPDNPRLASRFARMLRFGSPIGSLDGSRGEPAPFDRFVRVQKLSTREEANGEAAGWGDWIAATMPSWLTAGPVGPALGAWPRLLITAAAPFSVEARSASGSTGTAAASATAPSAPLRFADSVRVEVRHMGGTWRFDLVEMQRDFTAPRALSVRFVRNPTPPDMPLPGSGSCTAGAACGLLSLRRLPSPIAHIALEGEGLDPTRFGLLGRIEESREGLLVVLPQATVSLPLAGPESRVAQAIPVTELASLDAPPRNTSAEPGPSYWVLASASSNTVDNLARLILVGLGVSSLLFLLAEVVRASAVAQQLAPTQREKFLALGLNALLGLLLARLIIGARVTFFAPFLPTALETAIGLWVAIAVVTLGLLSWSTWAPWILKRVQAVRAQRSLAWGVLRAAFARHDPRVRTRGGIEVADASTNGAGAASGHAHAGTGPDGGIGGDPHVRSVRFAYGLLLLPLVLLALASWKAVVWGAGCGVVVLATWFTVAWTAAFSARRFYSFELGPFELIEYRGDDANHPKGFLELDVLALPLIWALALWLRGVGFLAVLVFWAVRLAPLVARRRARTALALPATTAGARGRAAAASREAPGARTGVDERAWHLLPVAIGHVASAFAVTLIASLSENGALAAFALVILVALVSVRAGRRLADQLAASRYSNAPALPMSRIVVHLIAPVVLLSPLAVIDMGLLLVMVIPIGAAALLAVAHRLSVPWRLGSIGIAAAVVFTLGVKVLHPNVDALRSDDPRVRADRFEQMQSIFGVRFVSLERAAARAVAARDQRAAEELLIAARPGVARDLLAPSIEQVWASRAYAAAGWFGVGLGAAPIGRGIAETVSYAENSYSVYVLHEHGVVGGLAVLFAYLMFAVAVLLVFQKSAASGESVQANRALFLVAALIVTIPAVYVALSNVGIVPITGQNMPFLGLNAWSDVTLCAGIVGMVITGAMRTETRQPRLPTAPATRALAEVA